jgi:hypothetical protein
MSKQVFRRLSVGIVLTICIRIANAQELSQTDGAWRTTDVLAGRLTVRVPPQARLQTVRRNIMAPEESPEELTQIVMDVGSEKLILVAAEVFEIAGADFEEAVRRELAPDPIKLEPWTAQAPVRVLAYSFVDPKEPAKANMLMAVFVAQADGTVQHVAFYVDPGPAQKFADNAALARRIAASITPGNRMLDSAAGQRRLATGSAGSELVAKLPNGYVATMERGPDFLVHHLTKLTPLGSKRCRLSLYLGDHPSFNPARMANSPNVNKSPATLLGKQVEWYDSFQKDYTGTYFSAQALVLLSQAGGRTSYAHFFLGSGDLAQMKELRNIAGTLETRSHTPVRP